MINQIIDKIFNNITILNNPIWLVSFWGNSIAGYAVSLAAFLVFLVLLKLIQVVLLQYLKKLSKKTDTDIDDTFVSIIGSIRPPFYSFLAFYLAVLFLNISGMVLQTINAILLVWVVYQIVIAVQILIDFIINKRFLKEEDKGSAGVTSFISGLLKASLWAVGFLVVLSNLGLNITSLVAGLGIGGLAIAFALQNILADLFSSLAIYIDKPFQVGDFIVIGEHKGVVKKIGVKTTRIQSLQGEEIVIANQELTSSRIQNFKKMEERRSTFSVGVTYETSAGKVKSVPGIIRSIIESIDGTKFDRTHLMEFADSALVFETVYYVESGDYKEYASIQQDINFKILEVFQKEGIEFAYPTQTVYVQKSV
jgi:small-conductance mechanosensitive channel